MFVAQYVYKQGMQVIIVGMLDMLERLELIR